jgi:hypothetical protein
MAFAKLSKTQQKLDFKIKKHSDVSHILRQSGNHSQGNSSTYVEVLSRLIQRIRRVRPQFQERGSWFLLYDNARPHTATSIKSFWAKQGIPELNHPQYYPDLSPPDFFLFPKTKSTLKGITCKWVQKVFPTIL